MNTTIKTLVTKEVVFVDSVGSVRWDAGIGGIKDIVPDIVGVHIMWNWGATFVPWSNVLYATELGGGYLQRSERES